MPRADPSTPLPDPTHEAYVQQRARGVGPTEAAKAVGLSPFKPVERQANFRDRLTLLEVQLKTAGEDPTLTLRWLVSERKRALQLALATNQLRTADMILSKLEELYERHPQLRGEGETPAAEVEEPQAPKQRPTRLERRMALRTNLSVVPEAARDE